MDFYLGKGYQRRSDYTFVAHTFQRYLKKMKIKGDKLFFSSFIFCAHQIIDYSIFKSSQLPLRHWQNYGGKKFKEDKALTRGQIETMVENTGFTLPVGTRK